jgi:23S rRNA pseudouridine2605 synthase
MSGIQTIFAAPKILKMNQKDQQGKRPRIQKDNTSNVRPKTQDDAKKPIKHTGEKSPFKKADRSKRYESTSERPYSPRRRDNASDDNRKPTPYREKGEGAGSDSAPNRPKRLFKSTDRREDSASGYKSGARKKPYAAALRYPEKEQKHRNYRGKTELQKAAERTSDGLIRLNKYLADSGVCSRREADKLIEAGAVTVNGVVVDKLGSKVNRHDKIAYGGQTLKRETLRYVLLNKPKGFITTSDDPQDRRTVMELVASACDERIYPVGRLDRNTLGLLLLTNDGDLAKKLTHPRYGVKKLYHVTLDKALTKNDMLKISEGIELEDGIIKVDGISWVADAESRNEVGVELHSGRNRIVRRIFESLGYSIVKLDRVIFASLTKVNLPRGRWRHLEEKEVAMLRMLK